MSHLSTDCRAVITRFVYNLHNGLLAYPVLRGSDYQSVLKEEPSAAEQTVAIFLNVLELDAAGRVTNADHAEGRAGQYLRSYIDPDYEEHPAFEDRETERYPYDRPSSGPMP